MSPARSSTARAPAAAARTASYATSSGKCLGFFRPGSSRSRVECRPRPAYTFCYHLLELGVQTQPRSRVRMEPWRQQVAKIRLPVAIQYSSNYIQVVLGSYQTNRAQNNQKLDLGQHRPTTHKYCNFRFDISQTNFNLTNFIQKKYNIYVSGIICSLLYIYPVPYILILIKKKWS